MKKTAKTANRTTPPSPLPSPRRDNTFLTSSSNIHAPLKRPQTVLGVSSVMRECLASFLGEFGSVWLLTVLCETDFDCFVSVPNIRCRVFSRRSSSSQVAGAGTWIIWYWLECRCHGLDMMWDCCSKDVTSWNKQPNVMFFDQGSALTLATAKLLKCLQRYAWQ